MLIQKHRLQRGWSQAQLATASGLSTRTIQRIEAGHQPSTETLKCIAAAFNIDFSELKTAGPEESPSESLSHSEKEEAEAFSHVRRLRGFYLHSLSYAIVVVILLAVNGITSPHYLWALWVMLVGALACRAMRYRFSNPR